LWTGDRRIRAAAETKEKQQRLTKWLSAHDPMSNCESRHHDLCG
jgi:hypothetical protein